MAAAGALRPCRNKRGPVLTTPEGAVKAKVRRLLAKYSVYVHAPVMNGMGAPSLDFICCLSGLYFAIETKAPGKKPTPRQEVTIAQIKHARGRVFVIDGDTSELETWLGLCS